MNALKRYNYNVGSNYDIKLQFVDFVLKCTYIKYVGDKITMYCIHIPHFPHQLILNFLTKQVWVLHLAVLSK